jgi:hypothetical protein
MHHLSFNRLSYQMICHLICAIGNIHYILFATDSLAKRFHVPMKVIVLNIWFAMTYLMLFAHLEDLMANVAIQAVATEVLRCLGEFAMCEFALISTCAWLSFAMERIEEHFEDESFRNSAKSVAEEIEVGQRLPITPKSAACQSFSSYGPREDFKFYKTLSDETTSIATSPKDTASPKGYDSV